MEIAFPKNLVSCSLEASPTLRVYVLLSLFLFYVHRYGIGTRASYLTVPFSLCRWHYSDRYRSFLDFFSGGFLFFIRNSSSLSPVPWKLFSLSYRMKNFFLLKAHKEKDNIIRSVFSLIIPWRKTSRRKICLLCFIYGPTPRGVNKLHCTSRDQWVLNYAYKYCVSQAPKHMCKQVYL